MIQTKQSNLSRGAAEQLANLLAERLRRENLSLNKYKPDTAPDRNQLSFHQSRSRYRVAFGGNQSGKSVVTAYEAAAWATNKHRWLAVRGPKEIYIIAPEYRILYIGIYRHLRPDSSDKKDMKFLARELIKSMGPRIPGAPVPIPSYIEVYCDYDGEGRAVADLPPGTPRPFSTIWFISADGGEEARKKIQAAAIDLAIVDEEVEESIWEELQMRFLAKDGRCCISCTLVRSEEWLLTLEERAERGDPIVFMTRLNTETSTHLAAAAKEEILGSLSDEMRDVRILGRSRRQHGLIFPVFDSEHVYDHSKTFPNGIPSVFRKVVANDPGFRVHAALWCAVDDATKTLYFYREMYQKSATLFDTCEYMADVEGYRLTKTEQDDQYTYFARVPKEVFGPCSPAENIDERLIDPAQLRNLEDGRISIASQMIAFFDTPVIPANNDVQSGIEAIQLLLRVNPLTNKPHIQISSTLANFFSERRRYRMRTDGSSRNSHSTKTEPLRKNNHLMDCWRYICIHVLSTYGGYYNSAVGKAPRAFGRAIDMDASISLADRLEEHAEQLRGDAWNKQNSRNSNPYVGSES